MFVYLSDWLRSNGDVLLLAGNKVVLLAVVPNGVDIQLPVPSCDSNVPLLTGGKLVRLGVAISGGDV